MSVEIEECRCVDGWTGPTLEEACDRCDAGPGFVIVREESEAR